MSRMTAVRIVSWLLLSLGGVAGAQSIASATVPRWNGAPVLALTTTAPTGDPMPESTAFTCNGCQGQSTTITGALHLATCSRYSITVCATSGQTLSGAGTIDIYKFVEFPTQGGVSGAWGKNASLTETIDATYAGKRCRPFSGHVADGTGWIFAAPNGVTTSSGNVAVQIEATCAF